MYDERGRQLLHVSFEGVVTENVYSETTGRLAQQKLFDNLNQYNNGNGTPTEVWSSAYDHLGRTVATTVVSAAGTKTWSQTFDAQGRVTSVASPEGTIRYAYDIHGRMIRTYTGADANDPVNDQRYTYDNFGRLDTLTVYERNDVPLAANAREMTENTDREQDWISSGRSRAFFGKARLVFGYFLEKHLLPLARCRLC